MAVGHEAGGLARRGMKILGGPIIPLQGAVADRWPEGPYEGPRAAGFHGSRQLISNDK